VKAGVLGRIIHEPSVATVRQARAIIQEDKLSLSIAAVGGVSTIQDLADFYEAGADAIMIGSAPMYLPGLAREVKQQHPEW
jgi:dihydroorotate dehydrogenase